MEARSCDVDVETSRSMESREPRRRSSLNILLTNAFGLASKLGDFQHMLFNGSPDVRDCVMTTDIDYSRLRRYWNNLPIEAFKDGISLDTMHNFKVYVNRWLKLARSSSSTPG